MNKARVWSRLENAAKIFPTTSTERDPKVFRLTCTLTEAVVPDVLQKALGFALVEFPQYRFLLRKGFFWHYFEESGMEPVVEEETAPPCQPLYLPDRPGLLFRVTYYHNRINLELFHALSDGTGAMQFMRALVVCYLSLRSGEGEAMDELQRLMVASREQFQSDAFSRYFERKPRAAKERRVKAYRIRGARLPDAQLGLIEGTASTRALLDAAHGVEATVTEYLTAVLILSILDVMPSRNKSRPIVITVPLDLRRFFPSFTVRNFFGFIRVSFDPTEDSRDFEAILRQVKSRMKASVTQEHAAEIISQYMALESNPVIRAIPLSLKILVLRLAVGGTDQEDTAALSNIGRVEIPDALAGQIEGFSVFTTTKRPQICVCSFGDHFSITFSSPLASTEVQRSFFQRLAASGIDLCVTSNLGDASGMEEKA